MSRIIFALFSLFVWLYAEAVAGVDSKQMQKSKQNLQLEKIGSFLSEKPVRQNANFVSTAFGGVQNPARLTSSNQAPTGTIKIADWKDNPPVLQNPDSLFGIPDSYKELNENGDLIPFYPPFPYKQRYDLNYYLEPLNLIPNVLPSPLPMPSTTLEKPQVYHKDFIISYQFLLKNEIPQGEKFNISEPLVSRKMNVNYECEIDNRVVDEDYDEDAVLDILLKLLLEYHKDEVLECLYKSGVVLREDAITEQNRSNNKTLFSLPPTYIRTSLENGFLKVLVLKSPKEKE